VLAVSSFGSATPLVATILRPLQYIYILTILPVRPLGDVHLDGQKFYYDIT
jgi:hypothetical protein